MQAVPRRNTVYCIFQAHTITTVVQSISRAILDTSKVPEDGSAGHSWVCLLPFLGSHSLCVHPVNQVLIFQVQPHP